MDGAVITLLYSLNSVLTRSATRRARHGTRLKIGRGGKSWSVTDKCWLVGTKKAIRHKHGQQHEQRQLVAASPSEPHLTILHLPFPA